MSINIEKQIRFHKGIIIKLSLCKFVLFLDDEKVQIVSGCRMKYVKRTNQISLYKSRQDTLCYLIERD